MNPFIQNYKLSLVQITESRKVADLNNISDGIIMSFETVTKTFCVEKQEKTSIYDIPYIENILFSEIKSNARDLLLYIIYNLKEDTDYINLKAENVCAKMKTSRFTLSSAITQLTDIAIICRKSQSEYWINPFYLFKGNRISFYGSKYPDCIEVVASIKREGSKPKSSFK